MTDKEPVSLDALNGLLKERQRYEEWLAALEAKRANTPESVYQRVEGDYQARLRDVSGKLAERAGELRENIDALRARLEEVARQESQQSEARQEAELRAAVGEYTEKQWKEIGGAWDKELARLGKEKSAVAGQLTELTRVFTLSTKEDAPGAVPVPPTLNPPSRAEPLQTPVAAQSRPATVAPPAAGKSPFDEFPVLRPSGGGGASAPSTTATVATPPSVPRSGGSQDPRSDKHKTLKCPECGAANYPTEWYCERCGGELATM
jgi:TolA-binding protein